MIHWYVMNSKPRKAAFLRDGFRIQQIEVYLPSIRAKSVNPYARKEQPFLPGYLFVQVDLEKIPVSEFQRGSGSMGLVCHGSEPTYVGDTLNSGNSEIDPRGY
jgi:transcription antitermination factor NusG